MTSIHALHEIFTAQQRAYQQNPMPTASERLIWLEKLKSALLIHQDTITAAIHQDYGNRSFTETKIGELLTCIEHIKYYQKHLTAWMKPQKRHISLLHQPATGAVAYQPYGVIGIIVPWNYPLLLAISPLVCALAAGNVAMIKLSAASYHFGQVLHKIISDTFDATQVAVITDDGNHADDALAKAFGCLPFDKLIFTGSSVVGRKVMQQAAANLTPVILELGGKSPAIVHPSMPLTDVAERVAFGKLWNAGQTCVAPDHLYLPRGKVDEFVSLYRAQVSKMYPSLVYNDDYTSIIHDRQFDKLCGFINDAKQKGATVTVINPAEESDDALSAMRKIAPTIITNVSDEMTVMTDEIFGPILPIIEYDDMDAVIDRINAGNRPLALYYFDYDKRRAQSVASRTHSGHFGVNSVLTHVAQDDLPFGGVGASGMGKYHGPEGFYSFSHARSVMTMPKMFGLRLILPPFHEKPALAWIEKLFLKK